MYRLLRHNTAIAVESLSLRGEGVQQIAQRSSAVNVNITTVGPTRSTQATTSSEITSERYQPVVNLVALRV